jgi:PII-like signaling protein
VETRGAVLRIGIVPIHAELVAHQWHPAPPHLEILKYLPDEDVFGAVAFHAVAGFLGRGKVHTAHLVEAGGELPVVISFVDTDEHVNRVLPKLREMAAHRLIVRENVVIEQGSLD